jgi:uncharacterized LabA/DUF88 family protein
MLARMADHCVVLVDNSNVFIEGQKHSARLKGIHADAITGKQACDPSWRVNFSELLMALANGRAIHKAVLVGSRPPKNDGVWEAAKRQGFEVVVHERSSDNKEKAVDTELVVRGTEIIWSAPSAMDLIIVSGDRDFIPLVGAAHRKDWCVEMAAFTSAFNAAGEMATSVEKITPLDALFSRIGRHDFDWPI